MIMSILADSFTVTYDYKRKCWVAVSDDLQQEGTCKESMLRPEDVEAAPAFALLAAVGYDIKSLSDRLSMSAKVEDDYEDEYDEYDEIVGTQYSALAAALYESIQEVLSDEERLALNKKYTKEKPVESMDAFWDWLESLSSDEIEMMGDDLPL